MKTIIDDEIPIISTFTESYTIIKLSVLFKYLMSFTHNLNMVILMNWIYH